MFWLWLYIAAMFCIALPVAWFTRNEVAAIVFVVWGLGQVAYQLGAPEPGTQVLIYGAAFAYVWARMVIHPQGWNARSVIGGALFAPLMLVAMGWGLGNFTDFFAWWTIYGFAMLQVALLTRPIVWARTFFRTASAARRRWFEHFSMVTA